MQRRIRATTARNGDGTALRNYPLSDVFSRTLFFAELAELTGVHEYAVDVHYYADELDASELNAAEAKPPAALYRDGVQILQSNVPSVFSVPGGAIEVATSMYGLRRMHYIPHDGPELVLRPDPLAPEGLRASFARSFPRLSATFNRAAMVVIVVGVIVAVPQSLETISRLDIIADQFGVFPSPLRLPDWLNGIVATATVVAGVERALTLRSHRLLDVGLELEESD